MRATREAEYRTARIHKDRLFLSRYKYLKTGISIAMPLLRKPFRELRNRL